MFSKVWGKSEENNRRLRLGTMFVDSPACPICSNLFVGNVKLDELIIFEQKIPCDDAYRLYHAYDSI